MDKNTINRFSAYWSCIIVFSWLNRPTPEQMEAQRRTRIQSPGLSMLSSWNSRKK